MILLDTGVLTRLSQSDHRDHGIAAACVDRAFAAPYPRCRTLDPICHYAGIIVERGIVGRAR
jgi:hypothetical protein